MKQLFALILIALLASCGATDGPGNRLPELKLMKVKAKIVATNRDGVWYNTTAGISRVIHVDSMFFVNDTIQQGSVRFVIVSK